MGHPELIESHPLQNRVRLRSWLRTFVRAATWCMLVSLPSNNGSKEDHILILELLNMSPQAAQGICRCD